MNSERKELVAPCGLDCGQCEVYLSREIPELKVYLIQAGIPEEKLPCKGCKPAGGVCAVLPGECATYSCSVEKGLDHCSECGDFPCGILAPALDGADRLPHNLKVYNLCTIKREGVEAFIKKSGKIKETYFKGKMVIGKGPELKS